VLSSENQKTYFKSVKKYKIIFKKQRNNPEKLEIKFEIQIQKK
jgi:hypothetical protein